MFKIMAPADAVPNQAVFPRPQTPPSSPELPPHKQKLSSDHVKLFVDLLKAAQSIQTVPAPVDVIQTTNTEETSEDKKTSRARDSKVEYKTVNDVYVPCEVQV